MAKYTLKRTPVFKSLFFPDLVWGGERELTGPIIAISLVLVVQAQTIMSCLFALILCTVTLPLIRKLAETDEYMARIYFRTLSQKKFYNVSSTAHVYTNFVGRYNARPKE